MKTISTLALAIALGLGGTAAAPAFARDKAPKQAPANYSQKVREAMAAAQTALGKNDLDTALAKTQEAEPSIQTPDDKALVGQFYVNIGQKKNDNALLSKGIDMMIDSGKAPSDLLPKLYFYQAQFAYQNKDYRKAEASLQQALKLGVDEPNAVPLLVEAMTQNGEQLGALTTLNQQMDKMTAAGKPVPPEWYQRGFAIAYQAKGGADAAAIHQQGLDIAKKWVAASPTSPVWHDALLFYGQAYPNDAELSADILRLQFAAGGMAGTNDYLEYAEAVYTHNPGEAKRAIDEGVKQGKINFTANRNAKEIDGIVTAKIPADKASLASTEKAARAAANGKVAVSTGDGYYGYGDYAKAADMYRLALTKGGVDPNLVNIRLGASLAMAGDSAGAKAALAQVTGPRKDLADFWVIHIDHPTIAAAAPAPAAG